ncbi:hypothetical protein J437_LFUL002704 [Ladona fulva]|uniref:Shootin-1 n=1 Tax=Ladona fulva TaxID=123851 RepID=A0A8K0NV18_LADFU|nr:hypothetical protein J437_LFUL002704 [Ladona fulva]
MPVRPFGEVKDSGGQREVGGAHRWGECSGLPPPRPKAISELFGSRIAQRPPEASWKSRFEDADRKRKQLMALAQKGKRPREGRFRNGPLFVCRKGRGAATVGGGSEFDVYKSSTAMYHEYEKLNNQYNEETGAYQKAMKQATSWYKENQELKRRSVVLAQKFMNESPEKALDLLANEMQMSSISSQDNDELEDLKKSVKDLSETVGRLQSELNSARLEEFEAQETAASLSGELEECMAARRKAEDEAKKAQEEIVVLKKILEDAKEEVKCESKRADAALRDRNTMAHQSAVLLSQALEEDYEGKVAAALMEIEALKKQLEEETIAHERQIKELEVEEKDTEARLELAEEQLMEMRKRAEDAEQRLAELGQKG